MRVRVEGGQRAPGIRVGWREMWAARWAGGEERVRVRGGRVAEGPGDKGWVEGNVGDCITGYQGTGEKHEGLPGVRRGCT